MKLFLAAGLACVSALATAQITISPAEAQARALANQVQLKAGQLGLSQQQLLRRGAPMYSNPQLFAEITPYEPLLIGIQQNFYWPSVYRKRTILQNGRIRLAELQLLSTTLLLKQGVGNAYTDLQYQQSLLQLLARQDSVQQQLAQAAQRYFAAGQINKLEELQTTAAAAQVRNNLARTQQSVEAARLLLGFYLRMVPDSISTLPLDTTLLLVGNTDTLPAFTIQQTLLNQQIALADGELSLAKAELLPQLQAGLSVPAARNYERFLGAQFGIGLPIFRKQNRAVVAAANMGVQMARATRDLEAMRLQNQYAQSIINYRRDFVAAVDYRQQVLPKADSLVTTAQRLFAAGQLNYTETLRNVQQAYELCATYLDLLRSQRLEAINIQYLNGTL